MAETLDMSVEVLEFLQKRVREEIELLDEQISKSRAARGAPAYVYAPPPPPSPPPPAVEKPPSPPPPVQVASPASPPPQVEASPDMQSPSAQFGLPSPTGKKGGMLRNWGKPGVFRSFNDHYVVVDVNGVRWYKSERESVSGKPLDGVPFFIETTNSRGSLFKKAAVCWPLITTEECPKATDSSKVYFGIQYHTQKGGLEFLVFGANSGSERDEWVLWITQFVSLYIPQGEEFAKFIGMKVGAEIPVHRTEVLGGEAPGSPKRSV